MKTLAIFVSVLSLAACATDDGQELDAIDKDNDSHEQQLDLDGAAEDWAAEQLRDPRFPHTPGTDRARDWLEDMIGGKRPINQLDDNLIEQLQGLFHSRTIEGLDDKVTTAVRPARDVDDLDDHVGEWAEEILIDGRLWTLIHGPSGSHYLIDVLGNVFYFNGPLGPRR